MTNRRNKLRHVKTKARLKKEEAGPEPPPTPTPQSGRTILYVLMLSLIYPAVLGSIFYTFMQDLFGGKWWSKPVETFELLFSFAVVCHYHIDFLYVYSFEVYSYVAFVVDLLVVVLLYLAFDALHRTLPNYQLFFICFLAIYLVFLPHEIIILRRYIKEKARDLMKVHQWMLFHELGAGALFIFFIVRPDLAPSLFGVIAVLAISFDYALILHRRTTFKPVI